MYASAVYNHGVNGKYFTLKRWTNKPMYHFIRQTILFCNIKPKYHVRYRKIQ